MTPTAAKVIIEHPGRLDYPLVWSWLMQDRDANFDQYGPVTCHAFLRDIIKREQDYEVIRMAFIPDEGIRSKPIGMMAAKPLTPDNRLWTLHGICFDKSAHGTGIPEEAMRRFLAMLWLNGAHKICASFFADNERVRKFLDKLGFVFEGLRRAHTVRNGTPLDMIEMAAFRKAG